MLNDDQIEEILELLTTYNENTKIYLGCDSIRVRRRGRPAAKFATVCILHKNGNEGCRIFSNISYENDFDQKANKPRLRMLNEVRKVCELYQQLAGIIDDFDVEIHLDISTDPKNGSNIAAQEAAGYVLGVTGIEPKFKPDSFGSSFGADNMVRGGESKKSKSNDNL